MDKQVLLTLAILIVTVGLLVSDRLRPDLVALGVVVTLGLTGVLTPQEAFSGFSRSAVVTIVAIFVLADGLQRTGVTQQVADLLLRLAGRGEGRLVVVVMLVGASLSLLMNNIAAAAVLLPAVSVAARKAGVSPSRLLMPLAFATMLGGMATLLTTTNIVVSSLLRDYGLDGYGLLDFVPVGLPLVAAGVLYMALWGWRRLPAAAPAEWLQAIRQAEEDLVGLYRLEERLFHARVAAGSPLVGQSLGQASFRQRYGAAVLAIERAGEDLLSPSPEVVFRPGDVLLLKGKAEQFDDAVGGLEALPLDSCDRGELESPSIVIAEAVLAPRSGLIGRTLRDVHFREKYGVAVLAIWRAGRPIRTGVAQTVLQFGDALLLQGPRERLRVLRSEPDLILLSDEEGVGLAPRKGWLALAVVGVALILVAFFPTLVGEIMLGGALALVLAGVLTMEQAYQAVEWKGVFLIAGMLPLGTAMTKTGAAALLADGLVALLGPAGPLVLLAGLFVLTALLAQTMHGAAVAAVVAPMAIQAAQQSGADPRAFAMGVALATSMTFLTPLGHPVNVLVMGPGGYRFRDYFHVGLPLVVLLFAMVLLLLPLLWPLLPG